MLIKMKLQETNKVATQKSSNKIECGIINLDVIKLSTVTAVLIIFNLRQKFYVIWDKLLHTIIDEILSNIDGKHSSLIQLS